MPSVRYRLLLLLREAAPDPLERLVPLPANCSDHDWFRLNDEADACRYCATERPHATMPLAIDSPEWNGLIGAIQHGSRTSAQILVRRVSETDEGMRALASEALAVLDQAPDAARVDASFLEPLRRMAAS